jgi:hypothetical protein
MIEVQLLNDGSVYETVVLNAENSWRYTWSELSPDAVWSVIEKDVPKNYTVLMSHEGRTFVLTNIYTPTFTTLEVVKQWNDAGYVNHRPSSVEVELICDDTVYETVSLSDENSWRHVWKELEPSWDWTVREKSVPNGYISNVKQAGEQFTIINTYTLPAVPEAPKLPQTGQLWWPIPVLFCMGLGFYMFALLWKKPLKVKDENE